MEHSELFQYFHPLKLASLLSWQARIDEEGTLEDKGPFRHSRTILAHTPEILIQSHFSITSCSLSELSQT